MAYYELPDGSYTRVPDGVDEAAAEKLARRKYPELYRTAKEDAKGGITANFMQGAKESLGDTGISYSALTGDTKEARGKISERDIAGSAVRTTNFDDVIEAFKKPAEEGGGIGAGISGIGSLISENFGRSMGYMAPAIAGGALVSRGLTMTPLAPVAAPIAAGLSALQLWQAYAGSNLARQQQERGQDVPLDVGSAQLAGAAQSALDVIPFLSVIGRQGIKLVSGVPLDVIKRMSVEQLNAQLIKDAAISVGKGAVRGGVKGLLFEMPTEAAQQVLERAQAGLGWDPFNKEVGEAGLLGGIIGGPMGALGGFADTRAAKRAVALQDKVKEVTESRAAAEKEAGLIERGAPMLDDPETTLIAAAQRDKLLAKKAELQAQQKALGSVKDDPSVGVERSELGKQIGEINDELKRIGPLVKGQRLKDAQEYMRTKNMTPEEMLVESSGTLPATPPRPRLTAEQQLEQRAAAEAALAPEERELLGQTFPEPVVVPKVGPATEAYLRSLEDPYQVLAIREGREALNPQDARAFLVRNPELAQAVLSGQESFPGIDPNKANQQQLNRTALAKALAKHEKQYSKEKTAYENEQANALKQSAYATLDRTNSIDRMLDADEMRQAAEREAALRAAEIARLPQQRAADEAAALQRMGRTQYDPADWEQWRNETLQGRAQRAAEEQARAAEVQRRKTEALQRIGLTYDPAEQDRWLRQAPQQRAQAPAQVEDQAAFELWEKPKRKGAKSEQILPRRDDTAQDNAPKELRPGGFQRQFAPVQNRIDDLDNKLTDVQRDPRADETTRALAQRAQDLLPQLAKIGVSTELQRGRVSPNPADEGPRPWLENQPTKIRPTSRITVDQRDTALQDINDWVYRTRTGQNPETRAQDVTRWLDQLEAQTREAAATTAMPYRRVEDENGVRFEPMQQTQTELLPTTPEQRRALHGMQIQNRQTTPGQVTTSTPNDGETTWLPEQGRLPLRESAKFTGVEFTGPDAAEEFREYLASDELSRLRYRKGMERENIWQADREAEPLREQLKQVELEIAAINERKREATRSNTMKTAVLSKQIEKMAQELKNRRRAGLLADLMGRFRSRAQPIDEKYQAFSNASKELTAKAEKLAAQLEAQLTDLAQQDQMREVRAALAEEAAAKDALDNVYAYRTTAQANEETAAGEASVRAALKKNRKRVADAEAATRAAYENVQRVEDATTDAAFAALDSYFVKASEVQQAIDELAPSVEKYRNDATRALLVMSQVEGASPMGQTNTRISTAIDAVRGQIERIEAASTEIRAPFDKRAEPFQTEAATLRTYLRWVDSYVNKAGDVNAEMRNREQQRAERNAATAEGRDAETEAIKAREREQEIAALPRERVSFEADRRRREADTTRQNRQQEITARIQQIEDDMQFGKLTPEQQVSMDAERDTLRAEYDALKAEAAKTWNTSQEREGQWRREQEKAEAKLAQLQAQRDELTLPQSESRKLAKLPEAERDAAIKAALEARGAMLDNAIKKLQVAIDKRAKKIAKVSVGMERTRTETLSPEQQTARNKETQRELAARVLRDKKRVAELNVEIGKLNRKLKGKKITPQQVEIAQAEIKVLQKELDTLKENRRAVGATTRLAVMPPSRFLTGEPKRTEASAGQAHPGRLQDSYQVKQRNVKATPEEMQTANVVSKTFKRKDTTSSAETATELEKAQAQMRAKEQAAQAERIAELDRQERRQLVALTATARRIIKEKHLDVAVPDFISHYSPAEAEAFVEQLMATPAKEKTGRISVAEKRAAAKADALADAARAEKELGGTGSLLPTEPEAEEEQTQSVQTPAEAQKAALLEQRKAQRGTPDFRLRAKTDTGALSETDYAKFDAPNGVTMVWDPSESPSLVRAAEEAGIPLDEVQGVTLPDGTIVVAGKNHASLRSLEETVAHEIGHERTNSYLGVDGYEKFVRGRTLMEIGAVAKDLGATDATEAMARATGEFNKKRAGASEIFAKLNEGIPYESLTARVKRFVNEWVGAAREWLRSTGFFELAKLRESDLYYVLSKAKKSGVETRAIDAPADFTAENAVPVTQRGWFSALRRAVENIPSKAMPAQDWARAIGALTTKGVKPAEIEWSGVGAWLAEQPGKVSKNEVLTFLEQNDIRLSTDVATTTEVAAALDDAEVERARVLTDISYYDRTPEQQEELQQLRERIRPTLGVRWATMRYPGPVKRYSTTLVKLDPTSGSAVLGSPSFEHHVHWGDAKNVFGSARYTIRDTLDNKQVLFVEEVQSDWGQAANAYGYKDEVAGNIADVEWVPDIVLQKYLENSKYMEDLKEHMRLSALFDLPYTELKKKLEAEGLTFSELSAKSDKVMGRIYSKDKQSVYGLPDEVPRVEAQLNGRTLSKYNAAVPLYGSDSLFEYANAKDKNAWVRQQPSFRNADKNVPNALKELKKSTVDRAPFIDKTDNWVSLLLKRMLYQIATDPNSNVDYVAFPDAAQAQKIERHLDQRLKKFYEEIVPKNFERVAKQTLGATPEKVDVEIDAGDDPVVLRAYRLTPEMKAKAAEGMPLFRRRAKLTDDEQRIVSRTQGSAPSMMGKLTANMKGSAFRTQFIDRWDALLRFVEQKYDLATSSAEKAAALQMQYWARAADAQSNFANAAMSDGVPGLKEIKNKDGSSNWMLESTGTSLKDVAEALGKDPVELFNAYMLAGRAARVGYDTIYGSDTPAIRADAEAARKLVNKYPSFAETEKKYAEYNKGLVNLLAASGFISAKSAQKMASSGDYIPAYRVVEDDAFLVYDSETVKLGNVRYQPDLAALKGSDQKIIPFPDSAIINTRTLISHALTNLAAKEAAFMLNSLNLGRMIPQEVQKKEGKGRNVIHFRQNGVDKAFALDFSTPKEGVQIGDISPDLLVTGMEGVTTVIPGIVKLMQPFSRALRYGVTRMPTYALRQLARDPVAAWFVTGTSMRPVTDTVKRLGKVLKDTDESVQLLRKRGLLGGQIYEGDNETIKRQIKWLSNDPNMLAKVWKAADKLAVDSDAVTRASVYDAALADGKTEMQAYLAALESMNFGQHGVSRSMHMANLMVPFLRAQINGIDTIYKAWTGRMSMEDKLKVRQELLTRGGMVAAATMLYALAVGDEDWYKQLKPEERYNFVHFKLPGVDEPLKLPIPFELGLLFKALPEALMDTVRGDEELDDAFEGMRKLVMGIIPNPVPQAVKPALEAMLNRSMFTSLPIEPTRTQGLPMGERAGSRTPEVIKALAPELEIMGKEYGLSPAKLEHLVRGYLGPMGIAITHLVDAALGLDGMPEGVEAPERKMSQHPLFGSAFQRLEGQNVLDKAYRMTEQFSQQAKSYKRAQEEGDIEKLQEFAENPKKLIYAQMDKAGRSFSKDMAEFKQRENAIKRSGASPQEKAEMIENLKELRAMRARAMFMQSKAVREAIASE